MTSIKTISSSRNFRTFVGALVLAFSACAFATAQSKSTLGEFGQAKKAKQTEKQKAPYRQLAKNLALQEKSKSTNQNSDALKKNAKSNDGKKAIGKKTALPQVSEARRAELMKFVDTHHKELRPLLNQLEKNKKSGQFQAAMRSLDRTVKNLQGLKKRSDPRYDRALSQWIVASKIQFWTARLAVKKTDKEKENIRNKLRSLLMEQIELRQAQIESEMKSLEAKNARLVKQIEEQNAKLAKLLSKPIEEEIAKRMVAIDKASQRMINKQEKAAEKRKAFVKEGKPPKKTDTNNN